MEPVDMTTAEAAGWVRPSADGYTDGLYAAHPAGLRALHDAVAAAALALGSDAEAHGRSTHIPVVGRTQFAAVAAGPRGSVPVGLRYPTEVPDDPRLEPAKGFAQATRGLHLLGDTDPASVGAGVHDLLAAADAQNG